MNYYIYILFSESTDKTYIGYTSDFNKRLLEHNTSVQNTFTSKYRPWVLKAVFKTGTNEAEAIVLERFLKSQKSKSLILKLIDPEFMPAAKLAQLVRVPHVRD